MPPIITLLIAAFGISLLKLTPIKTLIMTIIDQLEQTVTSAVLGASGSVADVSLLEQFYAILVTRLAVPEIYTQLVRTDQSHLDQSAASSPLFEQLWQQQSQRHLLIQELSASHHIDEATTAQLLTNAAHLAYQELKILAKGQYLPAFLQIQQADVRQYLPVWAAAVVSPVIAVVTEKTALGSDALIYDNHQLSNAAVAAEQALVADVPVIIKTDEGQTDITDVTDAIHANPSDYRTTDNLAAVRQRNKRNDLLIRLLLLGGALLAIGLVWALFFRTAPIEPVAPVVVAPVVPVPEVVAPVPQVLLPPQLVIAVDDSGNLYTCTATVGDVNLQGILKQALTTSFGDQSNICVVTVQEGIATTFANINIETLPEVLTLMRTTPFSRFTLQNDSITLEAPDDMSLQRLLMSMRTLLPAVTITAAAPIAVAQPPANTYDETYNNSNFNNGMDMPNNGSAPITNTDNVITNQPSQAPNSNNNNNNNYNNYNNNAPSSPQSSLNNNSNNGPQNNQPTTFSGPISQAEVDAMANNTIVAEPAQVNRPAN